MRCITFVDITGAKKADDLLRRSNALLRITQQAARAGGYEWEVSTRTAFRTEEMYRLHDIEPADSVPGTPADIPLILEGFRPEDRQAIRAAFQNCVEEGKAYDLAFYYTTVKGRRLRIRTLAEPLLEDGKVVRVIGAVVDITERSPENQKT